MPAEAELRPPPDPGATARAVDSDGEPAVAEPKPLQASLAAPRTEGDVAVALVLSLGATELANTDRPPLLVTPAVAPRTRAANCDEATNAPLPALAPLLALPLLGVVAPLVRLARPAPDVTPLATELPDAAPELLDELEDEGGPEG